MILRMLGVKIVLRLGNPPAPGRFYRFVWKCAINHLVSAFVCNSKFTEKELLFCGIPKRKVSYDLQYRSVAQHLEFQRFGA